MPDIAADVIRWRAAGQAVAVATVARVYGSAPRPLGAKLACTSSGQLAGSVSGGCIEGAVYEEAQDVLAGGPPRLLRYGVADESAWQLGLACGGTIEVWLERLDERTDDTIRACLHDGELVARATVVAGDHGSFGRSVLVHPDGRIEGDLGRRSLTEQVARLAVERLALGSPARAAVEPDGDPDRPDVLVEVYAPPPRLVVVGAVHIAIPLVTMAGALGYRTVVVDARPAFATRERFPHADELIVAWPADTLPALRIDRSTSIAVMTHDDKIDVPVLRAAVSGRARYIGILGSTRHHAQRERALRELGVTDDQLARIHAPIGLPIGAVGADEIALAVLAEIVAVGHGTDIRTNARAAAGTPEPDRPGHRGQLDIVARNCC